MLTSATSPAESPREFDFAARWYEGMDWLGANVPEFAQLLNVLSIIGLALMGGAFVWWVVSHMLKRPMQTRKFWWTIAAGAVLSLPHVAVPLFLAVVGVVVSLGSRLVAGLVG